MVLWSVVAAKRPRSSANGKQGHSFVCIWRWKHLKGFPLLSVESMQPMGALSQDYNTITGLVMRCVLHLQFHHPSPGGNCCLTLFSSGGGSCCMPSALTPAGSTPAVVTIAAGNWRPLPSLTSGPTPGWGEREEPAQLPQWVSWPHPQQIFTCQFLWEKLQRMPECSYNW